MMTRGSRQPWSDTVSMRNHLVHGYEAINFDRVWGTVTANLPSLIPALEAVLAREPEINPEEGRGS